MHHLDKLSESSRQVIEMRYIQRLSYDALSKRLNRPVGTLKGQIHRAMTTLKQHLRLQHEAAKTQRKAIRREPLAEEKCEYLKHLPEQDQSIMNHYYKDNLSISEIA